MVEGYICRKCLFLTYFGDFCTFLKQSQQSELLLASYKKLHFLKKVEQFLVELDGSRCLKVQLAKNAFFDKCW